MKAITVYPGSFSPPTYGHVYIAAQAAELADELIIICSTNPQKTVVMFTPEECKNLWQSYDLPANTRVITLDEARELKGRNIIMVRGIRDENDAEEEKTTMFYNYRNYGIKNFLYAMNCSASLRISSTLARQTAANLDLDKLKSMVSPMVVTALLEKILETKRLYLVAGKPATGKSSLLEKLATNNPSVAIINTDNFNDLLKPLLRKNFGSTDFIKLALTNEIELKKTIKTDWLRLLKSALIDAKGKKYVFVEVPYALEADKSTYRYLGGRILYFREPDNNILEKRIEKRKTPEHKPFIDKIPGWKEAVKIAGDKHLELELVDTGFNNADLEKAAEELCGRLFPERRKNG